MIRPQVHSTLHWFRLFMLLHVAGRSLLTASFGQSEGTWHQIVLVGQVLVSLIGFLPWTTLRMTRVALLLMLAQIALTFPLTANHVFLEAILLGLLALLDESDAREGALLLQALRWVTAIFFFYTGLQKVLYGTYFDGQFLGHAIANENHFARLFEHLLPPEEFERLRGLGASVPGRGPYRVQGAPLFLAVSNGVYVFEMLAPVLMLIPATRIAAALASIVFIALIEIGAREFVFGALMVNLLLLFLPGRWRLNRLLFPFFALGYAYLAAASFDLVPMYWYAL